MRRRQTPTGGRHLDANATISSGSAIEAFITPAGSSTQPADVYTAFVLARQQTAVFFQAWAVGNPAAENLLLEAEATSAMFRQLTRLVVVWPEKAK